MQTIDTVKAVISIISACISALAALVWLQRHNGQSTRNQIGFDLANVDSPSLTAAQVDELARAPAPRLGATLRSAVVRVREAVDSMRYVDTLNWLLFAAGAAFIGGVGANALLRWSVPSWYAILLVWGIVTFGPAAVWMLEDVNVSAATPTQFAFGFGIVSAGLHIAAGLAESLNLIHQRAPLYLMLAAVWPIAAGVLIARGVSAQRRTGRKRWMIAIIAPMATVASVAYCVEYGSPQHGMFAIGGFAVSVFAVCHTASDIRTRFLVKRLDKLAREGGGAPPKR